MESASNTLGRAFGNYLLERELGQGGMGTVYLAKDNGLNRHVALKILRADLGEDPSFATKFLEEVEVTASLAHPNIIRVFTLGEQDGRLYLVMEHLDQPSLEDAMQTKGKISEKEVLEIGIGIASALQFAHEETGLIHRDIKPGNILFGRGNIPKLADFGLAAGARSALGQQDEIWGTPYYVSPERLLREPEDIRSDIYSLGATLYHALAGRPPFEAETAEEVAKRHISDRPPPLRSLCPEAQEQTVVTIDKCLSKKADLRWGSYAELISQYADSLRRTTS
ncbi:MAG: serine/threonine protein kinase [Proteobacteria bacterium]|nr:serine/threonine protein kinase [Pseudomonadota bacterium]NBS06650.1 serine/threonine protein kinase [Verrucomicrobiota bacterium]NBV96617.1 serine/threonine protein kinase [Verrucomicrobiota bacterium]